MTTSEHNKQRLRLVKRMIAATETGQLRWMTLGGGEFSVSIGNHSIDVDLHTIIIRDDCGDRVDVIKGTDLPGPRTDHPYRSSPSPLDRLYAVARFQAMNAAETINMLLEHLPPSTDDEPIPED